MEEVREPKGGQQKAMVKGAESEDVRLASGKKKKRLASEAEGI